jgi:hypothetical protein
MTVWIYKRSKKNQCTAAAALAALGFALANAGCGGTSADQALDKHLKELNIERVKTAKFSGKVTVDGQVPTIEPGSALLIMLYDPKDPPTPAHPPLFKRCDPDGSFEFTRYSRGDGVPIGSYTVLFAKLKARQGSFLPPDQLKNLYDDPDKNQQIREFNVEVTADGMTDQLFNLEIAGKDPVANPGEHAVTRIVRAR